MQQVTGAQSVPNATNTDVKWDTLVYDTAGGFNLTTNSVIYTVQAAGVYLLMANVLWAANGAGDRQAWFQQNGVAVGAEESIPATGAGVQPGLGS